MLSKIIILFKTFQIFIRKNFVNYISFESPQCTDFKNLKIFQKSRKFQKNNDSETLKISKIKNLGYYLKTLDILKDKDM